MPAIKFTERELKVMKMICKEKTIDEIADKLKLSSKSIELIRSSLIKKTKSKNMVGVVKFAIKNGYFKV